MKLVKEKIMPIIMNARNEDMGAGDITTQVLFDKDISVIGSIIANEPCVFAGMDVAKWIFNTLDEKIIFSPLCSDGDDVKKGKRVISFKGSYRGILAGERTVLNFLGRLSGVASLTAAFVKKVGASRARIFDTRKTMPGLRVLEKYAVKVGGGNNHRMGLWDGILIKDNHLLGARPKAIMDSINRARAKGYKTIEIEVENLKEFKAALDGGADIIMLDNMNIEEIKNAVKMKTSSAVLEVSGGITLQNVDKIAKTGVDRISIGAFTHSAPSIDFSLEITH